MSTRTLLPLTVVFALTIATALGVAISPVLTGTSPAPAAARSKLFHHLRYHQSFPASRQAVLNAMHTSGEATSAELGWLEGQLPPGSYASGAEVMRAVFPVAPAYVVLALQQ